MTTEEIIVKLRMMARYPTVTLPRDKEALSKAADLLEQAAWVGLTDEEIEECFEITPDQFLKRHIAKKMEAKLKGKNNG